MASIAPNLMLPYRGKQCRCSVLAPQRQERAGASLRAEEETEEEQGVSSSSSSALSDMEIAQYAELLRQCSRTRNLNQGKHIHARLQQQEHDQNTYLGNLIVQMYGKCGDLNDARLMFERIVHKNLYSWSILISAYIDNGNCWEALVVFRWMQLEGVKPDRIAILSLLRACTILKTLEEGEKILEAVLELDMNLTAKLENALIALYGKCGSLKNARWLFDTMRARDVVSWNTMIGIYAELGQLEEALQLHAGMDDEGVNADRITFASIFCACSKLQTLDQGKRLHHRIEELGVDLNAIGISLMSMYGKCGSVGDAKQVFNSMNQGNTAVWNAMMTVYTQNGYTKKALMMYWRMDSKKVKRNEITYVSALAACAQSRNLVTGRRVHNHVIKDGLQSNVIIGTALINMYNKCGSLSAAKDVFETNNVTGNILFWTSMLGAYSQHGEKGEALRLFRRLDNEGLKPDSVAFASVLSACSGLAQVQDLHYRIQSSGYGRDLNVNIALITLYGRCGSLVEARRTFDGIQRKNVVSCTAMITAYTQNGCAKEAIELFARMRRQGVRPNEVTYVAVLAACSNIKELAEGEAIHIQATIDGVDTNIIVGNALIHMYGSCGSHLKAGQVFRKMRAKNSLTWNSMLVAYAQGWEVTSALRVLRTMYLEGLCPTAAAFSAIFRACNEANMAAEAELCLRLMVKTHGFAPSDDDYDCIASLYRRTEWPQEGLQELRS